MGYQVTEMLRVLHIRASKIVLFRVIDSLTTQKRILVMENGQNKRKQFA